MINLFESALSLLREYRGDIAVDDSNREACRELAGQVLLVVGHTFTGGREVFYRCTEMGAKLVGVLARMTDDCVTGLSFAKSASPPR